MALALIPTLEPNDLAFDLVLDPKKVIRRVINRER
jgi:hypothetical protein